VETLPNQAKVGQKIEVLGSDFTGMTGHPVAELKQSGELGRRCRCRTAPYLNNIIEQDHRFIKKRVAASLGFRSVDGACRTIAGYEAMHATRKGQVRWVAKGDAVSQRQFIHAIFGITA
jgi:transposase-like protein